MEKSLQDEVDEITEKFARNLRKRLIDADKKAREDVKKSTERAYDEAMEVIKEEQ